jgi:cation diffusion facilitator family transporter
MFSSRKGAARLAFLVVAGLVIFKAVVSFVTGSISITAQAVDSVLDLFAVGVMFFAVRLSDTPADREHPFGHGKIEGISASVQALLIFGAGGWNIYTAVERIINGAEVEMSETGIAVMVVSVIASIFLSRHLRKVAKATDSMALEASAQNINADIYSASGVLVAMVIIRITGLSIIDPIVGIIVSLFILKAGYEVFREAVGELLDNKLPEEDENIIIDCIEEHTHLHAGFHKVRTRKSGSQRFVDFHLMLPKNMSIEEAHAMADHIEHDIAERLKNISVTIHIEPCDTECEQCRIASCSLRSRQGPDK